MAKHICIISHQHLCRNPRVLKESIALTQNGYEVTIITSIYNRALLMEDQNLLDNHKIKYLPYNKLINKNFSSYKSRICNKLGRLINKFGLENKWALGYSPNSCLKMALQQHADLYICHQELPTYIGTVLLKQGKKVAFDFEDWYSEDLLAMARTHRPQKLLAKIENFALHHASICYTTSLAMANAMATRHNTKTPEVIFNSFEAFNGSYANKKQTETIKLIWISQTVGPGRGLEKLVQAMNAINHVPLVLHLRGDVASAYKETLKANLTNNQHSIKFLPLIPNDEIEKDLLNFDVGLALELNTPLSRDLTITNKIFHYLAVGLPVIASATQGQLSLKEDFADGISLFKHKEELIELLANLKKDELQQKSEQIKLIYANKYDWKLVEQKLLNLVRKTLCQND